VTHFPELYYLSERLAGDIVNARIAAGDDLSQAPRTTSDFEPVRKKNVEPLIPDNPFSLADHAELAVAAKDEAGDLKDPRRYVLLRNMRVRLWVFRAKDDATPRTAFVSVRRDPHLAVFLGSPKNVRGWRSERELDGWLPSDASGLRQAIRELRRDAGDSDLDNLDWDATIEDAADFAVNLTQTPDIDLKADILARVYGQGHGIDVVWRTTGTPIGYEFTRVLVGAPVFIREPRP
jgi:hypothetical protein